MDKFRLDVLKGDNEEMTEAERKEFNSLQKTVGEQSNTIGLLEKQTSRINPPGWFVSEFGEKFIISDPKITLEGWCSVVIALRAIT